MMKGNVGARGTSDMEHAAGMVGSLDAGTWLEQSRTALQTWLHKSRKSVSAVALWKDLVVLALGLRACILCDFDLTADECQQILSKVTTSCGEDSPFSCLVSFDVVESGNGQDQQAAEPFQQVVPRKQKRKSKKIRRVASTGTTAVFIANLSLLLSNLANDMKTYFQSTWFINIHPELSKPGLASSRNLQQLHLELGQIFVKLAVWQSASNENFRRLHLSAKLNSRNPTTPSGQTSSNWCEGQGKNSESVVGLATLTGWMLGYPCVYMYGPIPESRNPKGSNSPNSPAESTQPGTTLPLCQFSVPSHLLFEEQKSTSSPKDATVQKDHTGAIDKPISQFISRINARCKASKHLPVQATFQYSTSVRAVVPV